MGYSGSKCQRIEALVKASHKQLKDALALGVKKFGPFFLASKSDELPLFDNFPILANFRFLNFLT